MYSYSVDITTFKPTFNNIERILIRAISSAILGAYTCNASKYKKCIFKTSVTQEDKNNTFPNVYNKRIFSIYPIYNLTIILIGGVSTKDELFYFIIVTHTVIMYKKQIVVKLQMTPFTKKRY